MRLINYNPATNPEYVDQVIDALMTESPELRGIEIERKLVRKMLTNNPSVKCLVHIQEDVLIGVVIILISPLWYAPHRRTARDLLVWVRPEWRGQLVGTRLIRAIEEWAGMEGIHDLYLTQGTGINVERTAELYTHLGYSLMGFISHKRLDYVHTRP